MVISEKFQYLFIETPRTGSTAISSELRQYYSGRSVLHKHATFIEFKKLIGLRDLPLFIFAGVRNPLDDVVSRYLKLLNNHGGHLTNEKHYRANGGYITKRILKKYDHVQKTHDFGNFLRRYYRAPYTSYINLNRCYCDKIICFDSLNKDFSEVLKLLCIEQIRDLPIINPTENKLHYSTYFNAADKLHARRVFGPFMEEFGFEFPDGWPTKKTKFYDKALYELKKKLEVSFCRLVFCGPFGNVRFLRELVG